MTATTDLYRHRSTELLRGLVKAANDALFWEVLTEDQIRAQIAVRDAYLQILAERGEVAA